MDVCLVCLNKTLKTLFNCKSNKKAKESGKKYVFLQTVNLILK